MSARQEEMVRFATTSLCLVIVALGTPARGAPTPLQEGAETKLAEIVWTPSAEPGPRRVIATRIPGERPTPAVYDPSSGLWFAGVAGTLVRVDEDGSLRVVLDDVQGHDLDVRMAAGVAVYRDRGRRIVLARIPPTFEPTPRMTVLDGIRFYAPRLSPDGSVLLVHESRPTGGHLWLVSLADGVPRDLGEGVHGAWLPSGRAIVFSRIRHDGRRLLEADLWQVELPSGRATRLTDTPDVAELHPVVAPDGSAAAFVDGWSGALRRVALPTGRRTPRRRPRRRRRSGGRTRRRRRLALVLVLALTLWAAPLWAQKVMLNPSNQTANPVSGGGNEAEYALENAQIAATILREAGFDVRVDQDFSGAPGNANSWGADIFVSVHSNAGGGHGTETLYKTTGGQTLADFIQEGLLAHLPYESRGLKLRTDLYVLNATSMYACLTEAVFHDCTTTSGREGHPPSESAFLRSSEGRTAIGTGIAAGVCAYFGTTCGDGPVEPNEDGWLKGVVYEAPNLSQRVAGATVTLSGGQSVTTSDTGYWEFRVAPGDYTITANADGYYPAQAQRTVAAGEIVWGSIGLEPVPTAPDADAHDAGTTEPPRDVTTFPELVGRDVPWPGPGPGIDLGPVPSQDTASDGGAGADLPGVVPYGVGGEPSGGGGCTTGTSGGGAPLPLLVTLLALAGLRRRTARQR